MPHVDPAGKTFQNTALIIELHDASMGNCSHCNRKQC